MTPDPTPQVTPADIREAFAKPSDTPRTNAIPRRAAFHHYRVEDVLAHARELERELAIMTTERDQLQEAIYDGQEVKMFKLLQAITEACEKYETWKAKPEDE